MPYDKNNIFAKILRAEAPCVKLMEDDKTLAFMDVMPQAPGHALVIPKAPACDLFDLNADDAAALINTTQKIARAVKSAMNAPGILVAQLNGEAAGQTVFHVHMHVIPRSEGIDLALHARSVAETKTLEALAAKIRAALQNE